MATWGWILIALAVMAVIAIVALAAERRRSAVLRERFGPEYERTVQAREDRRAAEAELRDRERQRAELDIKPLPESARVSYVDEWQDVQELFVDEPAEAVAAAYALITRVLEVRGYPVRDFEGQAELVSVDYPEVVENYRLAHGVQELAGTQQTSTEDLRHAVLRYRSLFHRLLRVDGGEDPRREAPVSQAAGRDYQDQPAGFRGAT
jgi:hypothetical protein